MTIKSFKKSGGSLISLHACACSQEASFTGRRRVRVGDTEYTADHVLIATGGKPSMPDIPGVEVRPRVFGCLGDYLYFTLFVSQKGHGDLPSRGS